LYEPSPGQVAPRVLLQNAWVAGFYGARELHVLRCNGTCSDPANWIDDGIAAAGQYTGYAAPTNLALDASGAYHLVFTFGSPLINPSIDLYYLRQGQSAVSLLHSTDPYELSGYPSIGVDAAGAPRIAVHTGSSEALMYYACDANCSDVGNWSSEEAIPDVRGGSPSLVMGGVDAPRIVYPNGEQGLVQYTSGSAPVPPWTAASEAEASVAGGPAPVQSRAANMLAILLLPAALVVGWTWSWRRTRLH
jgi:hypothetical protein